MRRPRARGTMQWKYGTPNPSPRRNDCAHTAGAEQSTQPLQSLGRSEQRLVALGEAKANHAMVGSVLVERRQRNGRDANLPHQPLREFLCRFFAHAIVARELEITASARQQVERRVGKRCSKEVTLGGEKSRQRFIARRI